MTGLGTTLSRKRFGGGGLFLLALLLVLLLVPLWKHRGLDHPLAGHERLDACALMTPLPSSLSSLQRRAGVDNCDLLDGAGKQVLSMGLSSNRSIAGGSRHGTAEAYLTWMKEVRASGATEMQEQAGPWTSASSYRFGSNQQLLIEDGGLLIVLSSPSMDSAQLMDVARRLAPALRQH